MTVIAVTTPPPIVCPSWCSHGDLTPGDHWADPGGHNWPGVTATAYPEGGNHTLVAYPTWGELDGLSPAVALWLRGSLDSVIDLTPDEATRLATRLIAAVEAVKRG